MKVKDLKAIIDGQLKYQPDFENWEVAICVKRNQIGSTPTVEVIGAGWGFDWDHGKFMLSASKPLIELKADEQNKSKPATGQEKRRTAPRKASTVRPEET